MGRLSGDADLPKSSKFIQIFSGAFFIMLPYVSVAFGTFLMAVGVNMIYEPLAMVTGGFSGFAIVIKELSGSIVPGGVPVWFITMVLNIPLFIAAGYQRGRQYIKDTVFAVICFTVFMAAIPIYPLVEKDYLMAALMGGAVSGFGLALVFARSMSTGGTDLLSTLIQKFIPHISIAKILLCIDTSIVVFGIGVFGLRNGLYAIIAVIVTSKVMDGILEGLKFAKMVMVISDAGEQIGKQVMNELKRGVTGISVKGMFSEKNRMMLLCVVSRKEVIHVKDMVSHIDDKAFVIVSDVHEVKGEWLVKKKMFSPK